jgi:hypothetical protein
MALTDGFQLPFGIQPLNPVPTDSWSGPYEGADAATAKAAISGGQTQISGSFTLEETADLENVLRAGKLPAKADIVQKEETNNLLLNKPKQPNTNNDKKYTPINSYKPTGNFIYNKDQLLNLS